MIVEVRAVSERGGRGKTMWAIDNKPKISWDLVKWSADSRVQYNVMIKGECYSEQGDGSKGGDPEGFDRYFTVHLELADLKRIFEYCVSEGVLQFNFHDPGNRR